jgi:hypothetical protein
MLELRFLLTQGADDLAVDFTLVMGDGMHEP